MSKGIAAFVVVLAVIMSISILSGVGYYDELGISYDTGTDADVQAAADALTDQNATDTAGANAIVEFTSGAADTLNTVRVVVTNTGGLLQLLFGLPNIVAETIEKFFQIIVGITFIGFIRGVLID